MIRMNQLISIQKNAFWLPVVLATLAPFINFAAENVGEDLPVIWLLASALGISTTLLLLVLVFAPLGRLVMSRVAFVLSVLVILFFGFSAVRELTGASGMSLHAIHVALMLLGCGAAWRVSKRGLAWQVWLTVLSTMVMGSALLYVFRASHLKSVNEQKHLALDATPPKLARSLPARNLPNVYYLTLDSYPRADTLKEVFHFDNSPFLEFLKSKGFLVGEKSYTNYMATYLEVPAALEQRYIVTESDTDFWNDLPTLLTIFDGRNQVFKNFRDLGYYVAKLTFLTECPPHTYVNYCYGYDEKNGSNDMRPMELTFAFLRMTPLHDILTKPFSEIFHRNIAVRNMDHVIDMARNFDAPVPKFLFSHILLPHLPYIFTGNCDEAKEVDMDGSRSPDPKIPFLEATRCANKKTQEFVEYIVRNDPDSIVLINSDHGSPFTVDWSVDYDKWPESAIRERYGNLNAMRLPEQCKKYFYDSISPVNYFELVFACIEHRTPHFLEDRIYISSFAKSHKQYGQVWRYR